MSYRNGTELKPIHLIVNMNAGGMGDMIARTPALLYSLKHHIQISLTLYVFDFAVELFEEIFKEYKDRCQIRSRGSFAADSLKFQGTPVIDFHPIQVSSSKTNLTEYGFLIVENRIPARGPDWNYPRVEVSLDETTPKGEVLREARYGVLCTGYTSPVREWLPNHAFDVAEWMIQNGITPVYLGKRSQAFEGPQRLIEAHLKDEAIHPQGIDLRDATSLLEALKVMSGAQFVAGVDNGLLHLASLTDVPTIWGFTSILPHTRLPYRHGVQGWRALTVTPDATLLCRFCETRQNYVAGRMDKPGVGHDYKYCYYEDYECLSHLTAGKFIAKIKEIVGGFAAGSRQIRITDTEQVKRIEELAKRNKRK